MRRRDAEALKPAAFGLGLRRGLLDALLAAPGAAVDFLELAPENWLAVGGREGRRLRAIAERWPLQAHGLSLSIGGPAPLDFDFIRAVTRFLDEHGIADYSEHLSWCADEGQFYELLPMPFSDDAVRHVAGRVRVVQDITGRRLALENISYYATLGGELSELEFIKAVLAEADCELLLDINNVYVNAANHGYDAQAFIDALPPERVRGLHIAGHRLQADGLRIDTHGAPIVAAVADLYAHACRRFGARPTLLERDSALPPLGELLD
ncbi:MAG: HvfB family MNIO-type RiPP peptide maturase, partial [Solimonas sp.]